MAVILAPDPNDREFVIVDTTPTGADPDAVLSFEVADTRDEAADTLDAAAVAEQPWPDLDPETEHQDDQGGELSFGIAPILVGDTSTRAGWLQSALKAIVAPGLPVDGELGPHTVQAVQQFQRRSQDLGGGALVADGAVEPGTIAALERVTGARAPTVEATPQPPPVSGELTVREVQVDGVTEYVIRGGDERSGSRTGPRAFAITSPTTSAATRARARAC